MPVWTIKATNTINNAKIEERIEAVDAENARELFFAKKSGMSVEINEVSESLTNQNSATAESANAEKKCPKCAEMVKSEAQVCRFCGHSFVPVYQDTTVNSSDNGSRQLLELEAQKKSAGIAILLNFILPGAGYAYCGRIFLGLIAFVFVIALSIITGGIAAFILIPVVMIDGALSASKYNADLAKRILANS